MKQTGLVCKGSQLHRYLTEKGRTLARLSIRDINVVRGLPMMSASDVVDR